ncbi:MAG: hypothetical protein ACE5GE_09645, partial [Phycisphaerae bacterium]
SRYRTKHPSHLREVFMRALIDADAAEEMLAQARQRSARDPQAQQDRSQAIARASAQLKLARSR